MPSHFHKILATVFRHGHVSGHTWCCRRENLRSTQYIFYTLTVYTSGQIMFSENDIDTKEKEKKRGIKTKLSHKSIFIMLSLTLLVM